MIVIGWYGLNNRPALISAALNANFPPHFVLKYVGRSADFLRHSILVTAKT